MAPLVLRQIMQTPWYIETDHFAHIACHCTFWLLFLSVRFGYFFYQQFIHGCGSKCNTIETNIGIDCEPLRWRHNGRDGVSNHQHHHCLLNHLFRRRSKKTSKLRVTGLCVGNSSGTGEFPAQMSSHAENVSIWWRHHVTTETPRPPQGRAMEYL